MDECNGRLQKSNKQCLLQDISVELLLSVAKEFTNHLPAEAFPLQQEVGHAHRGVGNKPSLSQVLDSLLWLPKKNKKGEPLNILGWNHYIKHTAKMKLRSSIT